MEILTHSDAATVVALNDEIHAKGFSNDANTLIEQVIAISIKTGLAGDLLLSAAFKVLKIDQRVEEKVN